MIEANNQMELLHAGHFGCPGCTAPLAMKYALEALGSHTIVVMPAGCWSTLIGIYPSSCLSVPVISVAFATTAATASGVRAGLDAQGKKDVTVLAWAGDGGTFDIGLQALSGAAERNDDMIYVCYDNEAYMNTGIQRSSATPLGGWTTTTPASSLKTQPKKNIVEILAAHRIPYAATATVGNPDDFIRKMKKAKTMKGTRFIHVFASCPTGWRHDTQLSIEVARRVVASRVFPLYEVTNGETWTLNDMPPKEPIDRYLDIQGRFKGLPREGRDLFQKQVDREWHIIEKRCRNARKRKNKRKNQ